jgi:CubicO group peptidase (beta-lactamase class C family)
MSGYPGTAPFYKVIAKADNSSRTGVMTSRGAVEIIHNEIFRAKLDNLPGRVTKYSDIGFILLGHAIEHLSGSPLEKLANRVVFGPLGMHSSGFIDLPLLKRKGIEPNLDLIVPTARCPWRGRILCGEVHDDNAWAMGGIAPHAGVFTTAEDIHKFAWEMIRCWKGENGLIEQPIMRKFWTRAGLDPASTWALGWDTPSETGSSAGRFFSRSSVGHLSFTGCSLWIDPERELDVVLLSNRIHPTPDNVAIREFRPVIHDLVMEAIGFADGKQEA